MESQRTDVIARQIQHFKSLHFPAVFPIDQKADENIQKNGSNARNARISKDGSISLPAKLVMIAQANVILIVIFERREKSSCLKKSILFRNQPNTIMEIKLPARKIISSNFIILQMNEIIYQFYCYNHISP